MATNNIEEDFWFIDVFLHCKINLLFKGIKGCE